MLRAVLAKGQNRSLNWPPTESFCQFLPKLTKIYTILRQILIYILHQSVIVEEDSIFSGREISSRPLFSFISIRAAPHAIPFQRKTAAGSSIQEPQFSWAFFLWTPTPGGSTIRKSYTAGS